MGNKSEKTADEVVHAFLDAVEAFDFSLASKYLSPNRFSYRSPLQNYHSAADFMDELRRLEPILKRIDRRHTLSDGSETAFFFDVLTNVPDLASSRIALWAEIENGLIASMEFYYDAYAYKTMFEID